MDWLGPKQLNSFCDTKIDIEIIGLNSYYQEELDTRTELRIHRY